MLGAITCFALELEQSAVDSTMLGSILMVAGVVLFLVGPLLSRGAHKTVVDTQSAPGRTGSQRRNPPPSI